MQTVSDVGERGLIKMISEILGGLGNDILAGEDDAVAVHIQKNSTLVVNTDMLVSTTDVPPQMTLFQAARKAVVMTVSDILVKGAYPKWAVVALGISRNLLIEGDRGFKGLISGLKAGFQEYGIQYLGGDLNETKETVISCTIFGDAPNGVIPRSGAKPGDILICTGEMGKTGCGISLLLNGKDPNAISKEDRKSFIDSVLMPFTPIKPGTILAKNKLASASCDSSDGILTTIREICHASETGAEIDWNALPIAPGVLKFAQEVQIEPEKLILQAGEEFSHIFAIPFESIKAIKKEFDKNGLHFTKIGIINQNKNIILLKDGLKTIILNEKGGYEHFQ